MKRVHFTVITIALFIFTATIFTIITGCEEEEPPEPTPPPGIDLSSTLVPNADLDVYLFARQENPTVVLNEFVGTTNDFTVGFGTGNILYKKRFFIEIGGFDLNFFHPVYKSHFREDTDLGLRTIKKGKAIKAPSLIAHHEQTNSTTHFSC